MSVWDSGVKERMSEKVRYTKREWESARESGRKLNKEKERMRLR